MCSIIIIISAAWLCGLRNLLMNGGHLCGNKYYELYWFSWIPLLVEEEGLKGRWSGFIVHLGPLPQIHTANRSWEMKVAWRTAGIHPLIHSWSGRDKFVTGLEMWRPGINPFCASLVLCVVSNAENRKWCRIPTENPLSRGSVGLCFMFTLTEPNSLL